MTLQDLFDLLANGEIAQNTLGGKGTGLISPSNYPRIIPAVNLGLHALYKRFALSYDSVIVQQYAHITEYVLDYRYAVSNTASTEITKYIIDSQYKKFSNRLINVTKVENELGEEYSLEDNLSNNGIYLREYNKLIIPDPIETSMMVVTYMQGPETIPVTTTDPSTVTLAIPDSLVDALVNYVASRVLSGIGTLKNGVNESTAYMQKYELLCMEIDRYNLVRKDQTSNIRLEMNGWV